MYVCARRRVHVCVRLREREKGEEKGAREKVSEGEKGGRGVGERWCEGEWRELHVFFVSFPSLAWLLGFPFQ